MPERIRTRPKALPLAAVLLSAITSGCIEAPDLLEVSLPDDAEPGEPFSVRWAILDRDQADADHSELHWSVDPKSLERRVPAHRTGDGPYHEPDCGPMVNCAPGPHFVAQIAAPEDADRLVYQVHVGGVGWELHSRIVEVIVS